MNPQIEILYKLYEKFWLKTINENFTHKRISGELNYKDFRHIRISGWIEDHEDPLEGHLSFCITAVQQIPACNPFLVFPLILELQMLKEMGSFSILANAKRNGLAFYHSTARMKKVSFISFMHCCLASWRTRFVFQKPPTSCCGTGVAMGGAYYSKSFHPSANSIKLIYSKYLTNFL